MKENFKSQKDLFGGQIVFLLSGGRGYVAALLTPKAKWFATLTFKCCVTNVFSDQWKDTFFTRAAATFWERENRTVQSVAARSIVYKFLKRLRIDEARKSIKKQIQFNSLCLPFDDWILWKE